MDKRSTRRIGKRYGHLTVVDYHGDNQYLCRCSCGLSLTRSTQYLMSARSPFCGDESRHAVTAEWERIRPIHQEASLFRCSRCGSVVDFAHDPLRYRTKNLTKHFPKCYCVTTPHDPAVDGPLSHHYARSALRTRANLRPFLMDKDCRAAAHGQNPEALAQLMKTYELKATPIAPDPEKPFGINNFAWTLNIDDME